MDVTSLRDCFGVSFLKQERRKAITFVRDGEIETELTYLQLHRDSNRLASTFQKIGVTKKDRVILCIQKSLIFVVAHLALQKIGAICVPLNPDFKKSEMDYLLQDANPRLILTEPDNERLVQEIDPKLSAQIDADIKPEKIRAHCKNHLHDWKCPKEIVFVEALPRNTMGKVLKAAVKKIFGLSES